MPGILQIFCALRYACGTVQTTGDIALAYTDQQLVELLQEEQIQYVESEIDSLASQEQELVFKEQKKNAMA